jgi:hypothetical protein
VHEAEILSTLGRELRLRTAAPVNVTLRGRSVRVDRPEAGVVVVDTRRGARYRVSPAG